MKQGELDREEVMDDVQRLLWRDLGLGVLGQSLDLDVVLRGVCAYPVEGGFAQGGQGLAQGQRILDVGGHWVWVRHGPGARVSGDVEGEGVGERPGGSVAGRERVSQIG